MILNYIIMFRVIILVICSRKNAVVRTDKCSIKTKEPKKIYDQYILKYWKRLSEYIKLNHQNIKLYYLFGDIDIDDLELPEEDVLKFNIKESYDNIMLKTIEGLKYIQSNYDYDYVLRTNLSTFLHIDNFLKILQYLDTLNSNEIYAGPLMINHEMKHKFISGTSMIYSRDSIENNLLKNYNTLDFTPYSDDFELGKLYKKKITDLTKYYDKLVYLSDYDYDKNEYNFSDDDKQKLVNNIKEKDLYIFRSKNYDRQFDVNLMEYLTNSFY
jgi:hypothetical protein